MGRKTKMNEITSKELLKQVNPENMKLKRDFLNYLESTQKSPKTIYGYSNDLDIFFVWNLKNNCNKAFSKVTKRDIIAYQNWLVHENGNSASRVKRLKATLSSLSNYIEAICDDDPEYEGFKPIIRKIPNPDGRPVREKTVYTPEEIEDLLDKLTQTGQFEKACVVALAAYSGRRKSELLRFKVSDFDDDKLVCDGALYKSTPIKTKGKGGGKYIPCYTLAKKFKPYFDRWMQCRELKGIKSEWLFYDRKDWTKPLNENTLNNWTLRFSELTGKTFYWHSLRHMMTTYLAKSGIPDSVIQKMIGWESADMVRIYNDMSSDEEISMYFKDGDICVPESKQLGEI